MSKKNPSDTPLEENLNPDVGVEATDHEELEVTPEKTELQKLQDDFAELGDRYVRTLAEYDNYRKRSVKEREGIYPEAKAATIMEFLPVLDNFKRALTFECADTEFKKGMEMIFTSFEEAIKKLGVEEIGTVGELFDPALHNAVMHIEDEAITESTVVEVFQQGYKMGDRVLRYAMVKVAN